MQGRSFYRIINVHHSLDCFSCAVLGGGGPCAWWSECDRYEKHRMCEGRWDKAGLGQMKSCHGGWQDAVCEEQKIPTLWTGGGGWGAGVEAYLKIFSPLRFLTLNCATHCPLSCVFWNLPAALSGFFFIRIVPSLQMTQWGQTFILQLAKLWRGPACSWHKQLLVETYFLSTSPSQKLLSLIAKNVTWSLIWELHRIMKD